MLGTNVLAAFNSIEFQDDKVVDIFTAKKAQPTVHTGPAPKSAILDELEALMHPGNQQRLMALGMAIFAQVEGSIPPEAKAKLEEVMAQMLSPEVATASESVTVTETETVTRVQVTAEYEPVADTAMAHAFANARQNQQDPQFTVVEGDEEVTVVDGVAQQPQLRAVDDKPKANLPE